MKIYLHQKGVSLVGKSWEIKRKLQEYSKSYSTVSEWISNEKILPQPSNRSNVILFPSRKHD